MVTDWICSRLSVERVSVGGVLLALCIVAACNADSQADSAGSGNFTPGMATGGTSSGNFGQGGAGTSIAGSAALPPEVELDQTFRAPVATGRVLWSSNPESGRVALIDAQTLKVRMTDAGFGPSYLAAVPNRAGADSAIVLNVGSHDATFMQAAADGSIAVTTIPTHTGANSWSISDDGHFAIAWTDAAQISGAALDPSDGFSELTVIDLSASAPTSTRLSVGFRPSQVVFDAPKMHAYAVVEEGVSVLDLSGEPLVSALIPVTAPGSSTRDVNIAQGGSFAIVRVNGSADVEIVDLGSSTGATQTVSLESAVTDLDLSVDGQSATAVLGNLIPPKVVRFAVPNPGTDVAKFVSKAIPDEIVRSVTLAPDGQVALLYANAVSNSHLTLLDTSAPDQGFQLRTLDLHGAVQRVYVSPDSTTAITVQLPPSGSKKKGMFSVVPTRTARSPNIVGSDAIPQDVAFSEPAVGKALVTVHDSASTVYGVYVVGLANLEQNFVTLASEPLVGATGIVPDVRVGFVAQKHPEGRITFIDLDSGVTQTLTGFEIAARVVQ